MSTTHTQHIHTYPTPPTPKLHWLAASAYRLSLQNQKQDDKIKDDKNKIEAPVAAGLQKLLDVLQRWRGDEREEDELFGDGAEGGAPSSVLGGASGGDVDADVVVEELERGLAAVRVMPTTTPTTASATATSRWLHTSLPARVVGGAGDDGVATTTTGQKPKEEEPAEELSFSTPFHIPSQAAIPAAAPAPAPTPALLPQRSRRKRQASKHLSEIYVLDNSDSSDDEEVKRKAKRSKTGKRAKTAATATAIAIATSTGPLRIKIKAPSASPTISHDKQAPPAQKPRPRVKARAPRAPKAPKAPKPKKTLTVRQKLKKLLKR